MGSGSLSTRVLEAKNITVTVPVWQERRTILRDVSLYLDSGEAVGLVGESGSGKSMTAKTLSRLLPSGAEVAGEVRFEGKSVYDLKRAELRSLRTSGIGLVFQDPRSHTNPVRTIGDFATEGLRVNLKLDKQQAERRILDLFEEVGIDNGPRRLRQYPHELSGGLLQRVMIAAAVAMRPKVILADEPTTALDVITQSEVLATLNRLRHEYSLALLFITHDLDLAAAMCDRTIVMYAGSVVEEQASSSLHADPLHPYTAGLMRARPDIRGSQRRLPAVPGRPLSAFQAPPGCAFAPRCPYAVEDCRASDPELHEIEPFSYSRCHRAEDLHGHLVNSGARS
jgi:oligopeptide/dipeptide ABC transporter ATP-binding protein